MTERQALTAIVQRVLPVPPEIVFDAWLDAEALAEFMCPDPGKATHVECDPQVGGRLRIVMSYPDEVSEVRGEYLELDRQRCLRFTWRADSVTNSVVTVDLEPRGEGQTLMTITHTMLPHDLTSAYYEGWTSISTHLADLLRTRHVG
jgi:uncharacterized protein YndB with AHSA1/START domain